MMAWRDFQINPGLFSCLKKFLLPLICILVGQCAFAQAGYMQLTAYPNAAVADSHSQVIITAVATDSHGAAVPDGTEVDFTTDLGTFQQTVVTTKGGYAHGTLIAGGVAGVATVTVKVVGLVIPPATYPVKLVATRDELSSLNDFAKLTGDTVQYDPRTQLIQLTSGAESAKVVYGDTIIKAETIQIASQNLEVHAHNATLTMGSKSRHYSDLDFNLTTNRGVGVGNYKGVEITGWQPPYPPLIPWVTLQAYPQDLYGMVDIVGSENLGSALPYSETRFSIADFSELPFVFAGKSAILVPHQEVDFQHFSYNVGGAHTFSTPLYRISLNGANTLSQGQVFAVNDNQLAISYPYYLSLSPEQSSFFRFHIGDQGSYGYGAGNGPQMDFETDWRSGATNSGGLLVNGLGQGNWGVGIHQFIQPDNKTSLFAQIQSPQLKSLFGAVSANRQMGDFNLSIASNYTQTLQGIKETDTSQSLNLLHSPIKLGNLPLSFTYGLSANRQTTSLPVPIQSQAGYGLTANFQFFPARLDKQTTLNSSFQVSDLEGTNVGKGLTYNFLSSISRPLGHDASVFLTYSYSQDPFTASQFGNQRITSSFSYQKGPSFLNLSAGTSLGFSNYNFSGLLGYQFARKWSFQSGYTQNVFAGLQYLDYNLTLLYNISGEQVGLTWSRYTGRLGIVVLGTPLY